MKPNRGIIELAIAEARKSPHRFRVGAVIYLRDYRLGWGHNEHLKTHTKSPHPFKSIHAEFAATLRAVSSCGVESLGDKGVSIYVHRLRLDNSQGLAKPCIWCQKMLSQAGIKNIYWSDNYYGTNVIV